MITLPPFSRGPLSGRQIGLLSCELNQTAQWEGLKEKGPPGGTAFWVIAHTIYLLADRLAARDTTGRWKQVESNGEKTSIRLVAKNDTIITFSFQAKVLFSLKNSPLFSNFSSQAEHSKKSDKTILPQITPLSFPIPAETRERGYSGDASPAELC